MGPYPSRRRCADADRHRHSAGDVRRASKRQDARRRAGHRSAPRRGRHHGTCNHNRPPEVSPIYADFAAGFPPTLIQGGTREIFLSNFVRLYCAMVDAGQDAILDPYEGMPHAFQAYPLQMHSPESQAAIGAIARFLNKHLAFGA
ncbi:hypothetical protein GCM10011529_22800 [Polymorphobacter glacialis]|uniref:Alpha/beta hydrolase fold-3 domain-containing protein n=1 Tax=Sandarakinorhabdus glacialis TaxID=1614636 RepID=A0A916ZVB3_9SPHN|nr:hypothetical protein GCM10011529_22800 [Polymorphobacter glacialis]